eukprot:gene12402-15593_t
MDPLMAAWGAAPAAPAQAALPKAASGSSTSSDEETLPPGPMCLVPVGHVHTPSSNDSESDDDDQVPSEIGQADPAMCKVGGPGFAGSGAEAPVNLYLYAHDRYKQKLKEGGDDITVLVRPSGPAAAGAGQEIRASVVDHDNGTYTCTYEVPSKGNYQLSVEINGLPISGSPFPVFFSKPIDPAEAAAQAAAAAGGTPEGEAGGQPSISTMAAAAQLAISGLTSSEPIHRTLHVSNLSPLVTPEQLKTFFSITGNIKEFQETGEGIAATFLVTFETAAEAVEALTMNGVTIGDQPLRIVAEQAAQAATGHPGLTSLGGILSMAAVPLMISNPLMPNMMVPNPAAFGGFGATGSMATLQIQAMQMWDLDIDAGKDEDEDMQEAQMAQSQALAAQIAEMRSLARASALTKGLGTEEQKQARAAAAVADRLNKKFGWVPVAAPAATGANDSERSRLPSRNRSRSRDKGSDRRRSRSRDKRSDRRRSRSRSRQPSHSRNGDRERKHRSKSRDAGRVGKHRSRSRDGNARGHGEKTAMQRDRAKERRRSASRDAGRGHMRRSRSRERGHRERNTREKERVRERRSRSRSRSRRDPEQRDRGTRERESVRERESGGKKDGKKEEKEQKKESQPIKKEGEEERQPSNTKEEKERQPNNTEEEKEHQPSKKEEEKESQPRKKEEEKESQPSKKEEKKESQPSKKEEEKEYQPSKEDEKERQPSKEDEKERQPSKEDEKERQPSKEDEKEVKERQPSKKEEHEKERQPRESTVGRRERSRSISLSPSRVRGIERERQRHSDHAEGDTQLSEKSDKSKKQKKEHKKDRKHQDKEKEDKGKRGRGERDKGRRDRGEHGEGKHDGEQHDKGKRGRDERGESSHDREDQDNDVDKNRLRGVWWHQSPSNLTFARAHVVSPSSACDFLLSLLTVRSSLSATAARMERPQHSTSHAAVGNSVFSGGTPITTTSDQVSIASRYAMLPPEILNDELVRLVSRHAPLELQLLQQRRQHRRRHDSSDSDCDDTKAGLVMQQRQGTYIGPGVRYDGVGVGVGMGDDVARNISPRHGGPPLRIFTEGVRMGPFPAFPPMGGSPARVTIK